MRRCTWFSPFLLAALAAACAPDNDRAGDNAAANADVAAVPAPACQPSEGMPIEGRASPYDSATIRVGDGEAKVCYGRPSLRGRAMIGGDAVPYGRIWRTGANEPTILHLSVPARVAGMDVEPGAYSVYTIPRDGDQWTLIVNRSTSQWGHESRYTADVEAQEVGRADVHAERTTQTVEQFTIRPGDDHEGLVLEWQNTRVHIPVEPA